MGDPNSVAARIRHARERAGRNKNQLARALGTSWQHVDNWEKGKVEPSLASIRKLAELLDVSADFLLGLSDVPSPTRTALDRFFEELAPADLTEREAAWIREAPVDHAQLEPRDYLQLLHDMRGIGERRAPAKSGPRPKVDRAAIEAKIEADRETGS